MVSNLLALVDSKQRWSGVVQGWPTVWNIVLAQSIFRPFASQRHFEPRTPVCGGRFNSRSRPASDIWDDLSRPISNRFASVYLTNHATVNQTQYIRLKTVGMVKSKIRSKRLSLSNVYASVYIRYLQTREYIDMLTPPACRTNHLGDRLA